MTHAAAATCSRTSSYPRQLTLKGEIIQDAFRRIGRLPLPEAPLVTGSPERGYRMRARLHVSDRQIGFYLEGTHRVCDVGDDRSVAAGDLRVDCCCATDARRERCCAESRPSRSLRTSRATSARVTWSSTRRRTCARLRGIAEGLTGLSAQHADRPGIVQIAGAPIVTDSIQVDDDPSHALSLSRDVRAFFQGNRFLVEQLVRRVAATRAARPRDRSLRGGWTLRVVIGGRQGGSR